MNSTTQGILNSLNIKDPILLGEGGEAQTYTYTEDKVIRIYKSKTTVDYVEQLRRLYKFLASHNLSFSMPEIYEIHQWDTVLFVVEKKLSGMPIASIYEKLDERQKQQVLLNFFKALADFKAITFQEMDYGQVIHGPEKVTHYRNWPQFIKQTAPLKLQETRVVLQEDGIDVDKVMAKFEQESDTLPLHPEKHFVHGDYFLGNVLVNEKLEISAVLDVSPWSVVGDFKMDVAGAVMFLDLYDFVSPRAYQYVTEQAIHTYGEDILLHINIYRAYYSLLLSDCKRCDPPAYYWSLKNLQRYSLSKI